MSVTDSIGKRGESIAVSRLMDFCGNSLPYFDPHPLGEKCRTYDFLVEVIGGRQPLLLVEVKSTRQSRSLELELNVQVTAEDIISMVQCPIPTYLVGVDDLKEKAYIVSIHGKRSAGSLGFQPAIH